VWGVFTILRTENFTASWLRSFLPRGVKGVLVERDGGGKVKFNGKGGLVEIVQMEEEITNDGP